MYDGGSHVEAIESTPTEMGYDGRDAETDGIEGSCTANEEVAEAISGP